MQARRTALLIAAWMLIGTSFVYLTLHNEIPTAASLAALVLHPASGAAALSVVQLVSRTPNHQWMIAVPLLGASALAAYVVYSVSGKLQSAWSPRIATAVTAAVVTVASMVPWPLALSR